MTAVGAALCGVSAAGGGVSKPAQFGRHLPVWVRVVVGLGFDTRCALLTPRRVVLRATHPAAGGAARLLTPRTGGCWAAEGAVTALAAATGPALQVVPSGEDEKPRGGVEIARLVRFHRLGVAAPNLPRQGGVRLPHQGTRTQLPSTSPAATRFSAVAAPDSESTSVRVVTPAGPTRSRNSRASARVTLATDRMDRSHHRSS